jgi:hypothetical protein
MDQSTSTAQTDPSAPAGSTAGTDPAAGAAPVVVGLSVETPTGEPLGSVIEIVADASTGTPLFAVITSEGTSTAVPYTAAAAMVQGDALVMERERLASAPKVDQGEWRQAGDWTGESSGYWGEGETRTATPGTGTQPDQGSQQQDQPQSQEPTRY